MKDKNSNNNNGSQGNKSNGKKMVSVEIDEQLLRAFDSEIESNRSQALRSLVKNVAFGADSDTSLEAELESVEDEIEKTETRIADLEDDLQQARERKTKLTARREMLKTKLDEQSQKQSEIEEAIQEAVEYIEIRGEEPSNKYHTIAAMSEMEVEEVAEEVRSRVEGDAL